MCKESLVYMSIGERLKVWREHLQWSQQEFCKHTGIAMRTYQSYENNERSPGSSLLTEIAKTGLNLNWLLTGDGKMQMLASPGGSPLQDAQALYVTGLDHEWVVTLQSYLDDLTPAARKNALEEIRVRLRHIQRMDRLEQQMARILKQLG